MTCLSTRQHLRLYNAFWRKRFPELADIPKGNTHGKPRNGDRTYRLKHLASSVMRQGVYPRLKRLTCGLVDLTDDYSTVNNYLANTANQRYLQDLAKRSASLLPTRAADTLLRDYAGGELNPAVSLRLGTLLAYLG